MIIISELKTARCRFASLVLALILVSPFRANAQEPAGAIKGQILDPTGRTVVGAIVELTSVDGHSSRRTQSGEQGRYALLRLQPGSYHMSVVSDDFDPVSLDVSVADGPVTQDMNFSRARRMVTSVEVLGKSQELLQEIPGSAYLVSRQEIEQSNPTDANELLRRVPGINLREDSGPVAMRLNVGIRGLNPDRSRQILVLEDGIPISLAPYGEPEMYYSPPIDRMRGVEVMKGSGQILYGPQTIGGVLNFLTPDPPPKTRGSVEVEGGQRGFFTGQASLGGSTKDQNAGWLINFLRKQGDGFRNFFFDINDLQAKFTVRASDRHQFGIKLGVYDERSNSTYLGLTTPQFLSDANANSVPHDLLKLRRYSGSLSHTATLTPSAILSTSVFAYNTVRDWRRQNFDRSDLGKTYLGVEGDPSTPGGAIYLLDSAVNRNREFTVAGWQTALAIEYRLAGLRSKLDTGVRYVYEEADDKEIEGPSFDASTGTLLSDEDRFGKAFSVFAQNRLYLSSRVILTPGIRMEHYDYTRDIQRLRISGVPTNVDRRAGDTLTKAIPGLGLTVNANDRLTFFTGLHRGFAPPRTKDAITSGGVPLDLDAELSWNYEAGARFRPRRGVTGELTFFRMDFENQIIPAAQSGGATTTLVNGGATLHQGLETSLRVDWDQMVQSPLAFYTDIRYTYLPIARFTRNTLFQDNRLPYAPENILAFIVGGRHRSGLGFEADASLIGAQFGDNRETITPSNDGTVGLLPRYTIWNFTADYEVRRERVTIRPFVSIKNFTNELYISSRAPQGIQPGPFRQVNAGVKLTF